ncbi:MAG: arsenate reductase ArsC [Methanobacterium sp.]|uniref:arsenate reductase ArsC n=1 Tax=unclassified Methanobacterium TaxID=2627676 RepID=UPI000C2D4F4D|nr:MULTISPECIES: arsenate reductase ArsC [unclassified Methanobacterium]AUB58057.1 low molecular weight phosphatase family protein [Methanobacterium sp. MZ-A1]MCC7559250.1 arsenate reductase ArsC [Methanobacterium sp.]
MSVQTKKTVLFICNHNSARSQMAEGLLRSLCGEQYEACSAGSNPRDVNPYAVKILAELGVDISHHRSKSLLEFEGVKFDYVVTVCGGGGDTCPFFPGGKIYLHEDFDDPVAVDGTDSERTEAFRKIRDEIKTWIQESFRWEC